MFGIMKFHSPLPATMRLYQNIIIIIIPKSNLSLSFLRRHLVHDVTDCHSNTWVRFFLSDFTRWINKRPIIKWIKEYESVICFNPTLLWRIRKENEPTDAEDGNKKKSKRNCCQDSIQQRHWLCEWYNIPATKLNKSLSLLRFTTLYLENY